MSANRKFTHPRLPRSESSRQVRAGVLILALILAMALAGALWAAGGVALLTRAWEQIQP